ncbi:MAG: glycosyltransferase family 2 protein [Candidatus Riflebacteria bacterium]|nr:glycosyltransferase family 2 protein [Candidatus Riflebacteria bacterium]
MINAPEISVVSPCYNHGEFIEDMLSSVLAQTFQGFEVIIVNDGSNDSTRKKLDTICHPKVKILHCSHNGPSFARNAGIEEAKGKIVLNLDADDKIAPTYLEKAYEIFFSNPEIGIVASEVEYFGAKSGKFHLDSFSLKGMLKDNLISSTALFKKSDWEKAGGYSIDFPFGIEDYDFWLSILELGKEVYKIPETMAYYRKYSDYVKCRSERRKCSRKKSTLARLMLFHRHQKLFARVPEEYQKMMLLNEKWENESFLEREIKEVYHYARYRLRSTRLYKFLQEIFIRN